MTDDRIVFFDVETGGLDPARHPLIQFAAVVVDMDWNEVETYEAKLAFDLDKADAYALSTNCYDAERWRVEALEPRVVLGQVGSLLRRHATVEKLSKAKKPYRVARLAAHNARFDTEFLSAFFKDFGEFCPAAVYEPLDTLALARWVSLVSSPGPADHELGSLCSWLGIDPGQAHDALSDVRATVQVARVLSGRISSEARP